MIEGRPRESLVQYENPIEVTSYPINLSFNLYRFQQDKTPMIPSRRASEVTQYTLLTIITVLLIEIFKFRQEEGYSTTHGNQT
jgi:hypothetical protein